ncbi:hypothetical protein Anapl_14065 [Anas platyrhynchos]|uniref:Uncharacterized protein n=1 Tax=Anas platyrhynchos TaxID=8839 RepID=R0JWH2_ANAPL|nr:hypothetical protein Anapl_14065 [Anas platyrhynchos]
MDGSTGTWQQARAASSVQMSLWVGSAQVPWQGKQYGSKKGFGSTKKLLLRPAASPSNYYTQLLFFYMSTTGTARGERPAASRHDNIARVDNTAEAWWLGGIILQVMEKG